MSEELEHTLTCPGPITDKTNTKSKTPVLVRLAALLCCAADEPKYTQRTSRPVKQSENSTFPSTLISQNVISVFPRPPPPLHPQARKAPMKELPTDTRGIQGTELPRISDAVRNANREKEVKL